MAERYPLTWPPGWKRTPAHRRKSSSYKVSETTARDALLRSLKLLGARNVIVSTNIELRLDGLPYANRRTPDDVGVAVYWTRNGREEVIACDSWRTIRENYRAIGLAVEALRQLERCGASEVLERAFTGFAALPAPQGAKPRGWRDVLGFHPLTRPSRDEIEARFRELVREAHPDHGGTNEAFRELVEAKRQAIEEVSRG